MNAKIKITDEIRLVQYPLGRVLLHLTCLTHDGKWRWHLAGIRREVGALVRHPVDSMRERTL